LHALSVCAQTSLACCGTSDGDVVALDARTLAEVGRVSVGARVGALVSGAAWLVAGDAQGVLSRIVW
jgi:hypothetical protein